MNIKRAFIALFRAVQQLNEEQPMNEMRNFLADADPYIFKDRLAAVGDIQRDFEDSLKNVKDFSDTEGLYKAVRGFLKERTDFSERFADISTEEWKCLCGMVDDECDGEGVL